jgi:hypothetical protein
VTPGDEGPAAVPDDVARRQRLVDEFLATPDWGTARGFAVANLGLRDLGAVGGLMVAAREAPGNGDRERADLLAQHAVLLTGSNRAEAPVMITDLVEAHEALVAGRGDARTAAAVVGRVTDERFWRLCDPLVGAAVLNVAAVVLSLLGRWTGERPYLDEAVATARRAVEATPPTSTDLPRHVNSLSAHLGGLYEATGERYYLDEALATARRAVEATPPTSTELPGHLNNLANRLSDLYEATRERPYLDEARRLVAGLGGSGPGDQVLLGRTRSHLTRLDDDPSAAAVALEEALGAFGAEMERLRGDVIGLRDLAGRTEGLLSDLAACYALTEGPQRAVEAVEAPRTWLPAPPGTLGRPDVPVVWVLTSRWETVVLSGGHKSPAVVDVDHEQLSRCLEGALSAVRSGGPFSAVEDLFELTARVVSVFPSSDELVVVPVVLCAMLPFNAGRTRSGRYLVEQTAVTVAPSLAWATAAERARPSGPSFGAFCPGRDPDVLDLDDDRAVLEQAFPGASLLDSPTSDEVLSRLQPDGVVAHVSCHGAYDHLRPMSSGLELRDRLTLQAVLGHRRASWPGFQHMEMGRGHSHPEA